MNFIATLIAIGIGAGLMFLTREHFSDNTIFVVKSAIPFVVQVGFVLACVYYAKKYAKVRKILEKHGISEKEI